MPVRTTVLFGKPQSEIGRLLAGRMSQARSTSIVIGFATPAGLELIEKPILARPHSIETLVVGAATYPAFAAMDDLLASGVPADRLFVHLGHTRATGGRKHPYARFRPMLHSKIYLMEMHDGSSCALVGSHNLTSFALDGQNGEASVMLEGPGSSADFSALRAHVASVRQQAIQYSAALKDRLAWWTKDYLEGLVAEVDLPRDWTVVRTLLVFAEVQNPDEPNPEDQIYFEIPAGIEQIDSLKTETHLFLFKSLPSNPNEALDRALDADAQFTCRTLGADNKQGNTEVLAQWRIEGSRRTVLKRVAGGVHRPSPANGMQQVRAEVLRRGIKPYIYAFDNEKVIWDPVFSDRPDAEIGDRGGRRKLDGGKSSRPWRLVRGLTSRNAGDEKDEAALQLARPESGSFLLVSLRRRYDDRDRRMKSMED